MYRDWVAMGAWWGSARPKTAGKMFMLLFVVVVVVVATDVVDFGNIPVTDLHHIGGHSPPEPLHETI